MIVVNLAYTSIYVGSDCIFKNNVDVGYISR